MDYRNFMQILQDDGAAGESISMLSEYVSEFPYFQTAQSLLAREMHRQQHVRYERQLKLASAYSPDRKALHDLIHPKKTNLFSVEPVPSPEYHEEAIEEEISEENIFPDTDGGIIPPDIHPQAEIPEKKLMDTENPVQSFHAEESHFEEEHEIIHEEEELPPADPHEIIRRRLNEILGLHNKSEEIKEPEADSSEKAHAVTEQIPEEHHELSAEIFETPPADNPPPIKAEATAPVYKDAIEQIADESTKAVDIIDRGELEYALEASLLESLEKLPPIEKKMIPPVAAGETNTFLGWLKVKSAAGYGKIEEVHAYDEPGTQAREDEPQQIVEQAKVLPPVTSEVPPATDQKAIIEKFIRDEPKIVVSKAEFYSPAIQAKKSITEHDDIVSETLARIYHQQGNIIKARSVYEKLSLLYPEKKTYFAALISGIDTEINQQNKHDL